MNGATDSGHAELIQPVSAYQERYRRIRELGRGRFGIVYQVEYEDEERKEKRVAAAKHIRARKREVRERAVEEINILAGLSFPHIISFVSAFSSPSELVLVMEYLSGGELFERVAADDFALTEARSVQYVRQICRGVAYMHDRVSCSVR